MYIYLILSICANNLIIFTLPLVSKYVYFSNQIRTGPDAILCNKVGGGAGIVSWFCYFLYGRIVQCCCCCSALVGLVVVYRLLSPRLGPCPYLLKDGSMAEQRYYSRLKMREKCNKNWVVAQLLLTYLLLGSTF